MRDRDRHTELSSGKRVKRGLGVNYIILLINIELIKFSPFINAILKAFDAIKRLEIMYKQNPTKIKSFYSFTGIRGITKNSNHSQI